MTIRVTGMVGPKGHPVLRRVDVPDGDDVVRKLSRWVTGFLVGWTLMVVPTVVYGVWSSVTICMNRVVVMVTSWVLRKVRGRFGVVSEVVIDV